MRNKAISVSSDSLSEDDVPLKTYNLNGYNKDPNSYKSLCQHSIVECEFCDRISNNRYSSLIHNIKHIIIPLLNQTVFQCPTCLHSFTSERNLRIHTLNKHPEITVAQESLVNEEICRKRTTSHSSGHRDIKDLPQLPHLTNGQANVTSFGTKTNEARTESIKNRLLFEEDEVIVIDCDSDQLLNDLTTDCKVNLEVFDVPWMNGDEFSGKSVHYDELVKPGVYRCKKCGKGFPVRYDAIVHESSHITLKNTQVSLCVVCKKYLIGGKTDLRHHYYTYHRAKLEKNNHVDTEYTPRILFEENVEEKKTYDSKILTMCKLCLSFCKNTSNHAYESIKTHSEIGKRFKCVHCGQMFFEVKLVRRFVARRQTQLGKKKKKTNEERLKTIGKRFKMLKN